VFPGDTLTEIDTGSGVTAEVGLVDVAAQPENKSAATMQGTHRDIKIRSMKARRTDKISEHAVFGVPPAPGDESTLNHVQAEPPTPRWCPENARIRMNDRHNFSKPGASHASEQPSKNPFLSKEKSLRSTRKKVCGRKHALD
jgi:hypothetical protein